MSDQQNDTSWTPYLLAAGGIAAFGAVTYAAYKAAQVALPYALALEAPEYLPHYEAIRGAKNSEERRKRVVDAIKFARSADEDVATMPLVRKSEAVSYPRIEHWQRGLDESGKDEIGGYVYGKPGLEDGTPISISPTKVDMVAKLARTERSTYRLGQPARFKRRRNHPDFWDEREQEAHDKRRASAK